MDKRRRAQIYRNAARKVERGLAGGCCLAICNSYTGSTNCICQGGHPLSDDFKALFKPERAQEYWWGEPDEKHAGARVLALCFMAAMVEKP